MVATGSSGTFAMMMCCCCRRPTEPERLSYATASNPEVNQSTTRNTPLTPARSQVDGGGNIGPMCEFFEESLREY